MLATLHVCRDLRVEFRCQIIQSFSKRLNFLDPFGRQGNAFKPMVHAVHAPDQQTAAFQSAKELGCGGGVDPEQLRELSDTARTLIMDVEERAGQLGRQVKLSAEESFDSGILREEFAQRYRRRRGRRAFGGHWARSILAQGQVSCRPKKCSKRREIRRSVSHNC